MTLPNIIVEVVRLSVEIAELRIRADFSTRPGDGVELRGRLMGPRCPGMSTIEIAYPIKPHAPSSENTLQARVIIPEPNMWTATKPLTYWGSVEVYRDGAIESTHPIEIGLRKAQS